MVDGPSLCVKLVECVQRALEWERNRYHLFGPRGEFRGHRHLGVDVGRGVGWGWVRAHNNRSRALSLWRIME